MTAFDYIIIIAVKLTIPLSISFAILSFGLWLGRIGFIDAFEL